jgi:hypothetical protein
MEKGEGIQMNGKFINAFAAGLCTGAMILAYRLGNPTLFIVNGVLVGVNVACCMHREDK